MCTFFFRWRSMKMLRVVYCFLFLVVLVLVRRTGGRTACPKTEIPILLLHCSSNENTTNILHFTLFHCCITPYSSYTLHTSGTAQHHTSEWRHGSKMNERHEEPVPGRKKTVPRNHHSRSQLTGSYVENFVTHT